MSETPLRSRRRYAIKHTTHTARATVDDLRYRIDVNTLHRDTEAGELGLNDIGRVTLRMSDADRDRRLHAQPHDRRFILIDEATNDTVGAGMIVGARSADRPTTPARAALARTSTWSGERCRATSAGSALGQRGAVVWMTGLPASGKSTIAHALEQRWSSPGSRPTCSTATTCATA